MKIAAAVILYNPTEKQISNALSYTESFDFVFVVDNSEPDYPRNYSSMFLENMKYIDMKGNEGLPNAYNTILNSQDINDYDFLCTLDQDSEFNKSDIEYIRKLIHKLSEGDSKFSTKNIGIIAPTIDYGVKKINYNCSVEERERVITSGSFVNIKAIQRYGLRYDPNYFIDKFEIDLCTQLRRKGLKVCVLGNAILHQRLGEMGKLSHSVHNPLRHYYLFRNRLYYNHKFYSLIKRWGLNVLQTIKHIIIILLYEDQKFAKISQLPKAISDYCGGKMRKRIV